MIARSVITCSLGLLAACSDGTSTDSSPAPTEPTSSIRFTDVTEASGLDMTWTSGGRDATQIIEAKGGGLALIDYDGDGDLDVFIPNGATMADPGRGPGCRLWENLGDLRFRDATVDAGLTLTRWSFGVAVGDYDGDGHDDLYVTCFGANALLRNTGDGGFEERAVVAGAAGNAWSAVPAFGDLDGDGDLDLYVANYIVFDVTDPPPPSTFKNTTVFKGPIGLVPAADDVYENLGDGTFRERSVDGGFRVVDPAFGLGVAIIDLDHDGRQDVYVGNDSTPNFLFMNAGAWTFDERGARTGLAANIDGAEQSTMGIAFGDVSGNGFVDIFTTNFSNDTNTLHVNKAGRFFDDETRRYGVGMSSFPYVGWAAGLYDFDLDGDEDLLAFNGHVYPNATVELMDAAYREPPLLYERDGERFHRVTDAGEWLEAAHVDRGAAFGDLDGDGDVDVVVVELEGAVRVLRNDAEPGRWLEVVIEPPMFGTRVVASSGEWSATRWIFSGGSFASASARTAHFGLPAAATTVDVVVHWPDGRTSAFDDVATERRFEISSNASD